MVNKVLRQFQRELTCSALINHGDSFALGNKLRAPEEIDRLSVQDGHARKLAHGGGAVPYVALVEPPWYSHAIHSILAQTWSATRQLCMAPRESVVESPFYARSPSGKKHLLLKSVHPPLEGLTTLIYLLIDHLETVCSWRKQRRCRRCIFLRLWRVTSRTRSTSW